MWLYTIFIALVILGVAGGVFAGGIFTIVLVPIALIVLFSGLAYSLLARAAEEKAGAADADNPLPHQPRHEGSHVPTSPERLADARRANQ
jgi:hypothetical protein